MTEGALHVLMSQGFGTITDYKTLRVRVPDKLASRRYKLVVDIAVLGVGITALVVDIIGLVLGINNLVVDLIVLGIRVLVVDITVLGIRFLVLNMYMCVLGIKRVAVCHRGRLGAR